MNKIMIGAAALLALSGTAFAGPASDAVQFFYTEPMPVVNDTALNDRFVDPALTQLKNDTRISEEGEGIGCIDFALQISAQDYDETLLAKTLKLTEEVNGDDATVTATFNLFDNDPEADGAVVWSLKNVGGAWKIADIANGNGDWRLSEFDCK